MNNENNQEAQDPQSPQPSEQDAKDLKSAQMLVLAASIMGPVSMLIGGMPLGAAAIVCGVLALRKSLKLIQKGEAVKFMATRLRTACIVALVVSSVAFVLNAISFALVYPILMEAIESGDYSKILPTDGATSGGGSNSTWG